MIIECIKTVIMDLTDEQAFTAGKQYTVIIRTPSDVGVLLDVINDSGDIHGICHTGDAWFKEHFRIVPEDSVLVPDYSQIELKVFVEIAKQNPDLKDLYKQVNDVLGGKKYPKY